MDMQRSFQKNWPCLSRSIFAYSGLKTLTRKCIEPPRSRRSQPWRKSCLKAQRDGSKPHTVDKCEDAIIYLLWHFAATMHPRKAPNEQYALKLFFLYLPGIPWATRETDKVDNNYKLSVIKTGVIALNVTHFSALSRRYGTFLYMDRYIEPCC